MWCAKKVMRRDTKKASKMGVRKATPRATRKDTPKVMKRAIKKGTVNDTAKLQRRNEKSPDANAAVIAMSAPSVLRRGPSSFRGWWGLAAG